jgi:hypothetical protein
MSHAHYGLKMSNTQWLCHFGTQANKQFKWILNAWQFYYAPGKVFTVQCRGLVSALFTA